MGWFGTRAGVAVGLTFFLAVTSGCGGTTPTPMTPTEGGGASNDKGPAEVGKAAPDLSVKTVNGKGEITRDSLAGKVAIVDFWATWCGPCKQSFPKLEELAKQNQGKVQVVGISVDDKSDGVADFAKSNGATFPIGWDDGHAIANRWKVDSMPTTYILDSSGTVRYIHAGYHDGEAETIAKELATLAAEPASGKAKTEVASTDTATPPPPAGDAAGDKTADKNAGDKTAAASGDDAGDKTEETPPKKKPGKGAKPKPAGGKKPAGKPAGKKKPATP